MNAISSQISDFLTEQIQTQKFFMGLQALGYILSLVFVYYLLAGILMESFGLLGIMGIGFIISIPFLFFINKTRKLKKAYAADLANPRLLNKSLLLTKIRRIAVPDHTDYYSITFSDKTKVYFNPPLPVSLEKGAVFMLSCFSQSGLCYDLKSVGGKTILDSNKILHHLSK